MKHVTIYRHPNVYAGWPANHGAWQWDDELLVGFLIGPYDAGRSMHKIAEPYQLAQARSLDGGETWKQERTNISVRDGELSRLSAHLYDAEEIYRVRGVYDHGGDFVAPQGGFYCSSTREQ